MTDDYYVRKIEEMRSMSLRARDEHAKREFARLAEEYKALAAKARELNVQRK